MCRDTLTQRPRETPFCASACLQFNSQANPVNNKAWPLYRGLKAKLRLAEENEVKEEKKK